MELDQLRAFLHVVDAGSVQGAALRMAKSQPAVSRLVQGLEEALGHALLDRSTRPARPTDQGRALATAARSILASLDALRAGPRAPRSALRLGISHAVTRILATPDLPPILEGGSPLVLETGWSLPLLRRLREGALDAALLLLDPDWTPAGDLPGERLRTEDLVVVAPPGPALPSGTSLRDLAGLPWILNGEGCGIRGRIQAACAEAGRPLQVRLEVRGPLSDHIGFVAAGFGLGVVPLCALEAHPAGGALRRIPLDPPLQASLWALRGPMEPGSATLWRAMLPLLAREDAGRYL